MERSALGRSILVLAVLFVSIASTGQSTFAGTTACKENPGPPAASGMHWYYRLDRTSNRHCWYLQAAGLQVRAHEIAPLSQPRPQNLTEQSVAPSQNNDPQTPPSQPATTEGILIEASKPPIGAASAAYFAARWLDLPASVDLGGSDFATPRGDYAEHASPPSAAPTLATGFVLSDAISRKTTNTLTFGSVFIAGAISVILFGGLFIRVLAGFLARPRRKSELDDGSEITLSELMRALRRVDETLNTAEPRRYAPLKWRKFVAEERVRDHFDWRAHSTFRA